MTTALPASYSHAKNEHYLITHNRSTKCVCQLCSCGNHRCPRQKIKGQFDTSYGEHYKGFKIVPAIVQSSKPKVVMEDRHYNPEALRSNYQETYVEKEREREGNRDRGGVASSFPSRLEYVGREILKSGPFIANTSYKDQYKPFRVQPEIEQYPTNSPPPSPQKESRVKFQGQSSYKSAYHSLPIPKMDRYRHPQYKNPVPFTGSSSYKSSFSPFRIEPAVLASTGPNTSPAVRFEGGSTYNSHFRGFEVRSGEGTGGNGMGCQVDGMRIPPSNYISKNQHLYYDEAKKEFL